LASASQREHKTDFAGIRLRKIGQIKYRRQPHKRMHDFEGAVSNPQPHADLSKTTGCGADVVLGDSFILLASMRLHILLLNGLDGGVDIFWIL
jgi:hypothetical protein